MGEARIGAGGLGEKLVSIHPSRGVQPGTNVARPDLDKGLVERLAGSGVDDANVEEQVDTALVLTNIVADKFIIDIVWAFGNLWRRHAGGLIDRVSTVPDIPRRLTF